MYIDENNTVVNKQICW